MVVVTSHSRICLGATIDERRLDADAKIKALILPADVVHMVQVVRTHPLLDSRKRLGFGKEPCHRIAWSVHGSTGMLWGLVRVQCRQCRRLGCRGR